MVQVSRRCGEPGDNLFEIETDKVSMEVPATEAGILNEIRVLEGEVAPVGAIVGVIGDGTGAVVSAPAKSGPAAAAAPKAPAAAAATASFGAAQIAATADQARSIPRGANARAQFRTGAAFRRNFCHAAGAEVGGRSRDRSFPPQRLRPARPHRRARCGSAPRPHPHPAMPLWPRARPPIRSRRFTIPPATKKCRSMACARPLRRGCSRRSKPSRISI